MIIHSYHHTIQFHLLSQVYYKKGFIESKLAHGTKVHGFYTVE